MRRFHFRLVLLLLGVAFAAAPRAAQAASEGLWEHMPYRVQVFVALDPEAAACGDLAADLVTGLLDRSYSVVGARWNATVDPAPLPLRQAMLYGFDRLRTEQVTAAELPEDADKVLLVRVTFADGVYDIAVRDYDVRTQLLSPIVTTSVVQRQRVVDAAFQTMLAAFAPLGRVEGVDKDSVTLRLRAAAVPAREASAALPRDNTVFRPVVRTNDRAGKAKRVQPLDWTYLVGKEVEETVVPTRLVTAFQSPISPKKRGRTEQLALALHPANSDTTLQLRSADKDSRPLVGYNVYSHPIDSKETHLLGSTDARGDLNISPDEGSVRVLLIKSGGLVMARLPILPGLEPTALAPVPDDQLRLQVEGVITGFQEELVDLIARRQVLISRIRGRLKAGKPDEAKKLLGELKRMRTQADFTRELTVERNRRVARDPRTQKQIDKLFDDTQTVITRFLDSRPVDTIEREVSGKGPDKSQDPDADAET